jgi:hypothetical protein
MGKKTITSVTTTMTAVTTAPMTAKIIFVIIVKKIV